VTVSLTERHLQELEARQRIGDTDSRSAAVREILDEYEDLRTEYETLDDEYEDLKQRYEAREARIDQLEEQLRERSRVEEKIEDLPDKIRTVGTYQERRQRLLDEASLTERLKWKVTGVPVERLDDTDREES
jgi:archaellum component FlaC